MSLDWSKERYVRAYTRITPTWAMANWKERALFEAILKRLDRSGRMDLGKFGVRSLAATTEIPLDVVEASLPFWLDVGTLVMDGSILFMPNYVAAQTAVACVALRVEKHRETKRYEEKRNVTECNETLPNVTRRNAVKRSVTNVTPSLAEPSLAKPNQTQSESARSVSSVEDMAPSGVQKVAPPLGLKTEPPTTIPVTRELADRCVMAARPVPTETDAQECLSWHRREGRSSADWADSLFWWMGKAKTFQASARARASPPRRYGGGPTVTQPAIPVPPMLDASDVTDEDLRKAGIID